MASLQDPNGLQLVDIVLTNLALQYRPEGYVYDDIVSYMDVSKDHGVYPVWTQDDFFRDDVESAVGDRAETPEIDFAYSTASYQLVNRRLKVSITPEEQAQAHSALRLRDSKVSGLMDRFAIQRERRLAAALRKTTNGGQLNLGGGVSNKWDAGSAATILADIKAARKAIRDATGQLADTIVLSWNVAYAVAMDPSIQALIRWDATGMPLNAIAAGDRVLPNVIHGLNVVIAGAMYNSAREGAAMSLGEIWNDNVVLLKRANTNAWGTPATVYALRGNVANSTPASVGIPGEPTYALVDHWWTPDPPVEYIRAWDKRQEKIVAPDVGYEITDVLA